MATILEAVISDHAEMSNWFGPNSFSVKTSRYDDIKNGVDMVIEFVEDNSASHLALGIDVTFSPRLDKNFQRIKGEIEQGQLAKIKYFRSEALNFRGELTNLPRFVIMVDNKTAQNLAKLWFQGENNKLGEHFVQLQILSQILIQAELFSRYAQKIGKINIAKTYQKVKEIIKPIFQEKIEFFKNKLDETKKAT